VGLIVYVIALSALRALTLTDIQLLAKILPGGTDLYNRTLKTVKNSSTLTTIARRLLTVN